MNRIEYLLFDIGNEKKILIYGFKERSISDMPLIREMAEVEKRCFPPDEICTGEMIKGRMNTAADFTFIAESVDADSKIVGFISGIAVAEENFRDDFFFDSTLNDPEGKNIMILGLEVIPEYRGNGIAEKLMELFSDVMRKRGIGKMVLTCRKDKIAMYEKMGFYNAGISKSAWGDKSWYEMKKNLDG